MTKQELQEMINESVANALGATATTSLTESELDDAYLEQVLMQEDAAFAYLEAVNSICESFLVEAYDPDEMQEELYNQMVNNAKECKAKQAEIAEEVADSLPANATPEQAKESALKKVKNFLGKWFSIKDGKIVSIYKGKSGKGKQIAAIALTGTAVAGAIAAIALRIKKKKAKKAEEEQSEE